MSPAPGKSVLLTDGAITRTAGAASAALFLVGPTFKGPVNTPTALVSMDEYVATFGGRTTATAAMYDYAETYFECGGALLIVTRRVGSAAAKAGVNLFDQSGSSTPADVALRLDAAHKGAWGNDLNAVVTAGGGSFEIEVTHDTDGRIALSPSLADCAAALAWADDYADVFTLTLGASNEDPRAAASASLTGGTDDLGSITDAELPALFDLLTAEFGGGFVAAPNLTTEAAHTALLEAAAAQPFRTALLDPIDTADEGDLIDFLEPLRDLDAAHAGGVFGPWAVVRGYTAGTTRTVPWGAVQAGMIARNDSAGLPVGQAAAGRHGVAPDFVLGLSQEPWTEEQRSALNDAGYNVVKVVNREIRTYGNRTLVDPQDRPMWVEFSGSRTAALIANEADTVLENAMFALIDGRGDAFAELDGHLRNMCLRYFRDKSLFGELPEDAYYVDVGPTVNTPTTIGNREINAKLELATSPSAERVTLTISKQQIA